MKKLLTVLALLSLAACGELAAPPQNGGYGGVKTSEGYMNPHTQWTQNWQPTDYGQPITPQPQQYYAQPYPGQPPVAPQYVAPQAYSAPQYVAPQYVPPQTQTYYVPQPVQPYYVPAAPAPVQYQGH